MGSFAAEMMSSTLRDEPADSTSARYMRVESHVAKDAHSYSAVYATARPNGVLRECPETMVSRVDRARDGGKSALMAVTPDVKFKWVKRTPCKSPEGVSEKARVKGWLGPEVEVRG